MQNPQDLVSDLGAVWQNAIRSISTRFEDFGITDQSLASARMESCTSCDKYTTNKTCSQCGCYLPIKTALIKASCPLNKW
jgi:hypothetical protein